MSIKYPYTDFHEMNLDWLLSKMKEYIERYDEISGEFTDLKTYIETQLNDEALDEKLKEIALEFLNEFFNEDNIKALLENYTDPYLSYPVDYITFENIQTLTAVNVYDMMDEYVSKGILTRTLLGYATAANGGSDTDHPIYMYSWTRPYYASAAEKILISGSVHGNEKLGTSTILTMLHIWELGNNQIINDIFNSYNIDFIPIVNPYGYDQAIGNTMQNVESNIGRVNARGVNINRNGFTCWQAEPTESGTTNYKGTAAMSENETQILEAQFSLHDYYFDIHSERYTMANGDFPGRVVISSRYIRDVFLSVLNAMEEHLGTDYGLQLPLNTLSIGGGMAGPYMYIDCQNVKDGFSNSMLYEGPRYLNGDEFVESERCQKLTYDIFTNMLHYALPICQREYSDRRKIREMLKNYYPLNWVKLTPRDWEYWSTYVSSGPDAGAEVKNTLRVQVEFPAGKYPRWHFGGDAAGTYECRYFSYDANNSVVTNQNWHSADWKSSTPVSSSATKQFVELRKTDLSNINILNIGLDFSPTVMLEDS